MKDAKRTSFAEFDKWWNEASKDERKYMHEDREVCEYAWKAALEWIKYAGVLGPSLANDLIDEELKE